MVLHYGRRWRRRWRRRRRWQRRWRGEQMLIVLWPHDLVVVEKNFDRRVHPVVLCLQRLYVGCVRADQVGDRSLKIPVLNSRVKGRCS